ncbi:MAG: peptidoglycan-binding domain-containing protein [Sulfurovum sp.]|nr:peptidoglycan-binding domain-containing protein [Sulfurovum sp.]
MFYDTIKPMILVGILGIYTTISVEASFLDEVLSVVTGEVRATEKVKHKKNDYHRRAIKQSPLPPISDEMKIQKSLYHLGLYRAKMDGKVAVYTYEKGVSAHFYTGKIDGDLDSTQMKIAIRNMYLIYAMDSDNVDENVLGVQSKYFLLSLGRLYYFDELLNKPSKKKQERIQKIQIALSIQGFYRGKLDGTRGKVTRKAVRRYKKSKELSRRYRLTIPEAKALIDASILLNTSALEALLSTLEKVSIPEQESYSPLPQIMQPSLRKETSSIMKPKTTFGYNPLL